MKRALVVLIAALSMSGVTPARADHDSGVRWRERTLVVEDRLPADRGYLSAAFAEAVRQWNTAGAGITLTYRRGTPGQRCEIAGTLIGICWGQREGPYGEGDQYPGFTHLAHNGTHFGGAFVDLNPRYWLEEAWWPAWLHKEAAQVSAHELGHVLGFLHATAESDPTTVMSGERVSGPQPRDLEELRAMYPSAAVIAGSTWYSNGTRSATVAAGASVTAYATGAMSGVPYRLTLATAGCAAPVRTLNPTVVYAGANGLIGRVTGAVPSDVTPATYAVCFHSGGGTPTATSAATLVVTA